MSFVLPLSERMRIRLAHLLEKTQAVMEQVQVRLGTGEIQDNAEPARVALGWQQKAQVRSFRAAQRNAQDAISVVQVAEGALSEIDTLLVRLRELAVTAANETVSEKERNFLQKEFAELSEEVERLAQVASFAHLFPLRGEDRVYRFQVSPFPEDERISYDSEQSTVGDGRLGLGGLSIETSDDAMETLDSLDNALEIVLGARAFLGGLHKRLEHALSFLRVQEEAASQAGARLLGADFAEESARLLSTQLQMQSTLAVQAQASRLSKNTLAILFSGL